MRRKSILAISAVLACATAGYAAAADPAPTAKPKESCFWTHSATGFAAADEHTLNVRVGVHDVYQFEMFGPCQGLDWSHEIALVSRPGDMICRGMDAEVISRSPGFGRQRCMVRNVRKLTPEEVAALPKRARP